MNRKRLAPRNPYVAAAKFRKAGAHEKSQGARRQELKCQTNRRVAQLAEQETFNLKVAGSYPAASTRQQDESRFSESISILVFKCQAHFESERNAPWISSIPSLVVAS